MELQDTAASRVSIGFPLGSALLFVCLIFICGFFCCCLHWTKLQSFLQSHGIINTQSLAQTQIQAELASSYQKPAFPVVMMKQNYAKTIPVLMPGDDIPKFIATACPCEPPRDESITILVQKEEATDLCSSSN
ncbi:uncharacterized protein At5g65660-like [Glycine soja]|uniref:Uncharacterized protein n=1 Tax=Glycine soja TaxID=3848 RepID=A0A0B2QXD2_GLYSO|nr:uncharacterized protein At5g65660-like [Glycine soja]KAG4954885.1 hypothetical protein JHK87_040479 [Glycine soja]KHN24277.1 Hypothetical protein glysoja_050312 [Glycine soja]RZB69668.1 hypothetical protein D0Y65_039142 [Glycine soja]